jgi:deazaflavin-dependent oxidoreductase (nitroreductase family)
MAGMIRRWFHDFSCSKAGGVFYHVVSRRVDTVLMPLSGAKLSMGPPGFTALITTTGARSGKARKTSLAFRWRGDDMVVVASKGGADHHPSWYHNMKVHPKVHVFYRGGDEDRIAREATGEERDELFAEMAATYANFAAYQTHTDRVIPVMVLSKV